MGMTALIAAGSAAGSMLLGRALSRTPSVPTAPTTPTNENTQADQDVAAQQLAASQARGRTSTMLNGATGVNDAGNTSKILLGQ